MTQFAGKVVMVTGGGAGMGRAAALALPSTRRSLMPPGLSPGRP